jgi:hypothetical protein
MGLRASRNQERQAVSDTSKKTDPKGEKSTFTAGIAVGVGSAAIVAALLYARSNKSKKK